MQVTTRTAGRQQQVAAAGGALNLVEHDQVAIEGGDGQVEAGAGQGDGAGTARGDGEVQIIGFQDMDTAADAVAGGQIFHMGAQVRGPGADAGAGGQVGVGVRAFQVGAVAAAVVQDGATGGEGKRAIRLDQADVEVATRVHPHGAGIARVQRGRFLAVAHDDVGGGGEVDEAAGGIDVAGHPDVGQGRGQADGAAGAADGAEIRGIAGIDEAPCRDEFDGTGAAADDLVDEQVIARGQFDGAGAGGGDAAAAGQQGEIAASRANQDVVAARSIGLTCGNHIERAAGAGFVDLDVANQTGIERSDLDDFRVVQRDATGRPHIQVATMQCLAGEPVGGGVALADRTTGGIQDDVMQVVAGPCVQAVVDDDVLDRVEQDAAADGHVQTGVIGILDDDAATIDLGVVAQGRLARRGDRGDAHGTGGGGGMATALLADDDGAETVIERVQVGVIEIEGAGILRQRRGADLDGEADRGGTQGEGAGAEHGERAAIEVDLVALQQQIAVAVQTQVLFEHDLGGPQNGEVAAIVQGDIAFEGNDAGSGDGDIAIHGEAAVEGDVVGRVAGDAGDGEAVERVECANVAVETDVIRRQQGQAVGRAVGDAIQRKGSHGIRGRVIPQMDGAAAVAAGGERDGTVDQHRVADQMIVGDGHAEAGAGEGGGVA